MKVEPAPLSNIRCAKDSVDMLVARIPTISVTAIDPAKIGFKVLPLI